MLRKNDFSTDATVRLVIGSGGEHHRSHRLADQLGCVVEHAAAPGSSKMIRPTDYPELHFIMWDQRDSNEITPELAHALYRERWPYVFEHRMQSSEAAFVDHLEKLFGAIRNHRAWRRARGAWASGKPIFGRTSSFKAQRKLQA